jgi:hypothetical protein
MCSSLNDNTWLRPRIQFTIHQCILGSPSLHHGAPHQHQVCKDLFGKTQETERSKEQHQKLLQALESKYKSFIKLQNTTAGILSSKCEHQLNAPPGTQNMVCDQCLLLKKENSLKNALNTEYAARATVKYISGTLIKQDLFHNKLKLHEELQYLNVLLKKHSRTGNMDFWTNPSAHAKHGLFDDMDVFKGLVEAVAVWAECKAAGKALNGMQFNEYFDGFLTTMAAMSPATANHF